MSVGVFVGYQFHTNFAVEGSYRSLNAFVPSTPDIDQSAISVVGSQPLSNGFGVFARLGYNDVKVRHSCGAGKFLLCENFSPSNGVLVGVGATYAFTPSISARAEIQRPSSDLTNFGVGVAFGF
ncbi:outer membrane beta-barrel protein [Massilia sp. TSP1-1-2]|uniref:outer membrane beta-barrel protein n=1 Tax=Massilia sp. TSP1-1-2 TaxID=2804649 RepID=UPI003CEA48D3